MTREELIAQAKRRHLIQQAKQRHLAAQTATEAGAMPGGASPEAMSLLQANKSNVLGDIGDRSMVEVDPEKFPASVRAGYKNLGDPTSDASFNLLQKKAPNFEFKKDNDGRVLVRERGSNAQWDFMDDPESTTLRDVTDIAYDVPAAVIEGAGTAAGGVYGGLPGASVGGGLSAAAMETARQGLGNLFDYQEGFNPEAIKTSAKFGAAAPWMFGTGAGAKQIAKYGGKKYLGEAGKEALKAQVRKQAGLPGRAARFGTEKIAPVVTGAVSGINPEVITNLANKLEDIKVAKQSGARSKIYKDTSEEVGQGAKQELREAGDRLGQAEKNLGEDVTIATKEFEKPLDDLVDQYQVRYDQALEETMKNGLKAVKKKFGGATEWLENLDISKIKNEKTLELKKAYDKAMKNVATEAKKKVDKNIIGTDLKAVKKQIEKHKSLLSNPVGTDVPRYLRDLNKMTEIAKNQAVKGSGTAKSDVLRVSRQVADDVNSVFQETQSGLAYQAAKDDYGLIKSEVDRAAELFGTPAKARQTMKKVGSGGDDLVYQDASRIAEKYNVPLKQRQIDEATIDIFSDPKTEMFSSGGTTSTSKTVPLSAAGGFGGYWLGQKIDKLSPFLTAAVGAAGGSKLASPKMIRNYVEWGQKAKGLGNQFQDIAPSMMQRPAQMGGGVWNKMRLDEQNKLRGR